MHLPNGTLLQGGRYKIVRFISSGGFGCTYEAEHVMLEKKVAIKEFFVKDFCNRNETSSHVTIGITSKRGLVDKLRCKFIDEARAISQMHHPNIVSVSDVFEENGTAYYVMDYIDGMSLGDVVKREGQLTAQRALRYIRQTAEALKYVHDKNRLHLDVKPANIMLDKEDNAILIDFGTSKQYDEEGGENTSTLMGKTPGYAPLEQMGNDVVMFTPATDIYALGATLYKLLTGITPMSATLIASGEALSPLPNTVSNNVAEAISAAMQINKTKRPQTIDNLLAILGNTATQAKRDDTELDVKVIGTTATTGSINGHEWVDLGLSVKWATCNVGASSPEDYGDYYAWGETSAKSSYTVENSKTYGKSVGGIAGNSQYDVARANWGGSWRLPTASEIDELVDKCKYTWTTQGEHNGYLVTGPNGNSIFFPAGGWRSGVSLYGAGGRSNYWSSSPAEDSAHNAYILYFQRGNIYRSWSCHYFGRSVRPVSE